jgi:hypothetical protein
MSLQPKQRYEEEEECGHDSKSWRISGSLTRLIFRTKSDGVLELRTVRPCSTSFRRSSTVAGWRLYTTYSFSQSPYRRSRKLKLPVRADLLINLFLQSLLAEVAQCPVLYSSSTTPKQLPPGQSGLAIQFESQA